MAPCVRGLRRRSADTRLTSWQGERAGCLISQRPGLSIYYHLFSHLRVTWEGKRELAGKGGKLSLTLRALPALCCSLPPRDPQHLPKK